MKKIQMSLFDNIQKHFSKIIFVLVAIATGVIASLYASLFSFAEKILRNVHSSHLLLFVGSSFVLLFLSWLVVYLFAPDAKGSGIPQVLYAIKLDDGELEKGTLFKGLGIRTAIIKVLSSFLCLLGGGAIGREGPTIQIGACVFFGISRKVNQIFGFKNTINPKTWIIAGGAAGLAAAFNTPLGGLVFAMEELVTDRFSEFKNEVLIAIIVSGMASLLLTGPYLYLGVPQVSNNGLFSLVHVFIVAILCGLGGAYFGKFLGVIAMYRKRYNNIRFLAFFTFLCSFVLLAFSLFVQSHVVGSGKEMILKVLFDENLKTNFMAVLYRFFAPIVTYGIGGAGGIFAPSLAAGASIGHFFSTMVGLPFVESNLLILVGMVSFLTAVTRTPFTSFVLVLEMTDRHSAIFFMMLAALISYLLAKMIDKKSFYQMMMEDYLYSDKRLI